MEQAIMILIVKELEMKFRELSEESVRKKKKELGSKQESVEQTQQAAVGSGQTNAREDVSNVKK